MRQVLVRYSPSDARFLRDLLEVEKLREDCLLLVAAKSERAFIEDKLATIRNLRVDLQVAINRAVIAENKQARSRHVTLKRITIRVGGPPE